MHQTPPPVSCPAPVRCVTPRVCPPPPPCVYDITHKLAELRVRDLSRDTVAVLNNTDVSPSQQRRALTAIQWRQKQLNITALQLSVGLKKLQRLLKQDHIGANVRAESGDELTAAQTWVAEMAEEHLFLEEQMVEIEELEEKEKRLNATDHSLERLEIMLARRFFDDVLHEVDHSAHALELAQQEHMFSHARQSGQAHLKIVSVLQENVNENVSSSYTDMHLVDAQDNVYVLAKPNDITAQYIDESLLNDIIGLVVASFVGGLTAQTLRFPIFLGYIMTGMLLGQAKLIHSVVQIQAVAEFGAIFIIFFLGLQLSFANVKRVLWVSVLGGPLMIVATILCMLGVGTLLGRDFTESLLTGCCLSLSSTAIVLKCLGSHRLNTPHGRALLGILVMHNVALCIMLASLPLLELEASLVPFELLRLIGSLILFLAFSLAVKRYLISRYLVFLSMQSADVCLLGIVVFGWIWLKISEWLGLSQELGCFVGGLVLRSEDYLDLITASITPLRDLFSLLFFASIGLHISPLFLLHELGVLVVATVAVVSTRFLINMVVLTLVLRYDRSASVRVALGLSQVNVFCIMLAARGKSQHLLSRELYYLLVGVTTLSLVLVGLLWNALDAAFGSKHDEERSSPEP